MFTEFLDDRSMGIPGRRGSNVHGTREKPNKNDCEKTKEGKQLKE